ncbi:MAG: hypothetical protein NT124_02115, partial [Candidatus Dependentiae bacterium]|nr:hypothetical protein [Candidatus Dependentiae bacterium]
MKINLIVAALILGTTSISYATYITMPKALVLKNTFCSNGLQYFSNNSDLADRLGEQKIDGIVIPIIAA